RRIQSCFSPKRRSWPSRRGVHPICEKPDIPPTPPTAPSQTGICDAAAGNIIVARRRNYLAVAIEFVFSRQTLAIQHDAAMIARRSYGSPREADGNRLGEVR